MNDLLLRKNWVTQKDEPKDTYIARIKLQDQQFIDLKRVYGRLFIVKFSDDDLRPLWESQINVNSLKNTTHTPINTEWECPLCQPYDNWTGFADMERNRRYLCKVVAPKYKTGCIDEEGTYSKCICILPPRLRKRLKIQHGA